MATAQLSLPSVTCVWDHAGAKQDCGVGSWVWQKHLEICSYDVGCSGTGAVHLDLLYGTSALHTSFADRLCVHVTSMSYSLSIARWYVCVAMSAMVNLCWHVMQQCR